MEEFEGFRLVVDRLSIAGLQVRIARIADVDALFARLLEKPDDHPDIRDERIPYWAEVWPSAIGLAEVLARNPGLVRGKRVLEVGCGLGLPGIVAGMLGGDVRLSDYMPEPLVLAGYNWSLNLESAGNTVQLDWRSLQDLPDADVVLASDVAYETRAFSYLHSLIDHYRKKGTAVLISEPNRTFARVFFDSLSTRPGYRVQSITVLKGGIRVPVRVHFLI